MFHVRDRRTISLFDPWGYLGPKRRKLLDRSWAGLFRKEILPHLPVEAITAAFHARLGRPSKDAYTLMGALVFQRMHDTTDEETVRQLAFNTEWHYALDLSDESDEGKYVCLRTLWTMRQLLAEKKLDQLLFDTVTTKLASLLSRVFSEQCDVVIANVSDAHALLPAIEGATRLGLAPTEVLADSLYGSDKNMVAAADKGVEVVSPVMGQTDESEVTMADFSFSDYGAIVACPQGHAPIIFRRKGKRRTVVFANGDCLGCPKKKECPIKPVRDGYGFRYTEPALRLARRRAAQKTAAFKDRYRHRSGVESTMSAFDRLTGVKHLRVRGMKAVRFAVMLKALGVNLIRAAAAWTAGTFRNPGENDAPGCRKGAFQEANSELVCLHAAFESVLVEWTNRFIRFNTQSLREDDFVLQRAA